MGGGGQTTDSQSTTASTNVTQLPPWVSDAAQQNYAFAQSVANRPLQQYQGQLVADIGPQTQQSWDLAANSGQAGAPEYQGSESAFYNVAGYNPNQVSAQQINPQSLGQTNLSPYMNPYTNQVINSALPIMQQSLAQQQGQLSDQASRANAFGGSRQGVQAGVTGAQGALQQAQLAAQLQQANFGQAQQAATGDITRNLQAQQANQAANLQAGTANQSANQAAINSQLQAAQGLGTLGSQAQQNQRQQYLELAAAGQQEQQQAQNLINAQVGQFNQAWGYPQQQLNTLLTSMGMTPYGTASSGTSQTDSSQTTSSNSPMSSIFGALQMAGSLFPGGSLFGGLSGASGGTSDRNLKTDIQKVGTHPLGVPLYSYRYKGDPKSYPKITGPMAEDVMKVAPHLVRPAGIDPSGQPRLTIHPSLMGGPPAASLPTPSVLPPSSPGVPGALGSPGPVGAVGALGRSMQLPRRPGLRMPRPAMTGALANG